MIRARTKRLHRIYAARLLLGIAAGSLAVPAAHAEFDPVIGLGTITATEGTVFIGEVGDFQTGTTATSAGDVNGDGITDIIIGAALANHVAPAAGSAYVVFGKVGGVGSPFQLSSLDGSNGFRLDGVNSGHRIGARAGTGGDINGDGFDDIAIGATGPDTNGDRSGSASVVFGRKSAWPAKFKLSSLDGTNGFRLNGTAASDYAGTVAPAGDFNGDGYDDLLISALGADIAALDYNGAVYVLHGKDGTFPANSSLSTLTGSKGTTFAGSDTDDAVGVHLSALGDVNGDGFDDFGAGAPSAAPNGSNSGKGHVVLGRPTQSSLPNLISQNGLTFRLEGTSGDRLGQKIGGGVDLNGDGFDDVIVGAIFDDPGGDAGAGSSYVVMGKSSGLSGLIALGSLDGTTGFRLDGAAAADYSGVDASGAGDFNGDGFGDVLVGAQGVDDGAQTFSGRAYLLYGRAPETFVIRQGSAAGQYISGGPESDVLAGVAGNDVLEARGGTIDTMSGGDGKDTASYAHAPAGVIANLADNAANTGDATADVYDLIEGLEGSRFADTLTGDDNANHLIGGLARDTLKGGMGKDHYRYAHVRESKPGSTTRDVIVGFNPGKASTAVDIIDLRKIDANSGKNGNQKFKFIGTAAFTGKGQLRLKKTGAGIIVQGNVKGGLAADFEILLKGQKNTSKYTAKDFKL